MSSLEVPGAIEWVQHKSIAILLLQQINKFRNIIANQPYSAVSSHYQPRHIWYVSSTASPGSQQSVDLRIHNKPSHLHIPRRSRLLMHEHSTFVHLHTCARARQFKVICVGVACSSSGGSKFYVSTFIFVHTCTSLCSRIVPA